MPIFIELTEICGDKGYPIHINVTNVEWFQPETRRDNSGVIIKRTRIKTVSDMIFVKESVETIRERIKKETK